MKDYMDVIEKGSVRKIKNFEESLSQRQASHTNLDFQENEKLFRTMQDCMKRKDTQNVVNEQGNLDGIDLQHIQTAQPLRTKSQTEKLVTGILSGKPDEDLSNRDRIMLLLASGESIFESGQDHPKPSKATKSKKRNPRSGKKRKFKKKESRKSQIAQKRGSTPNENGIKSKKERKSVSKLPPNQTEIDGVSASKTPDQTKIKTKDSPNTKIKTPLRKTRTYQKKKNSKLNNKRPRTRTSVQKNHKKGQLRKTKTPGKSGKSGSMSTRRQFKPAKSERGNGKGVRVGKERKREPQGNTKKLDFVSPRVDIQGQNNQKNMAEMGRIKTTSLDESHPLDIKPQLTVQTEDLKTQQIEQTPETTNNTNTPEISHQLAKPKNEQTETDTLPQNEIPNIQNPPTTPPNQETTIHKNSFWNQIGTQEQPRTVKPLIPLDMSRASRKVNQWGNRSKKKSLIPRSQNLGQNHSKSEFTSGSPSALVFSEMISNPNPKMTPNLQNTQTKGTVIVTGQKQSSFSNSGFGQYNPNFGKIDALINSQKLKFAEESNQGEALKFSEMLENPMLYQHQKKQSGLADNPGKIQRRSNLRYSNLQDSEDFGSIGNPGLETAGAQIKSSLTYQGLPDLNSEYLNLLRQSYGKKNNPIGSQIQGQMGGFGQAGIKLLNQKYPADMPYQNVDQPHLLDNPIHLNEITPESEIQNPTNQNNPNKIAEIRTKYMKVTSLNKEYSANPANFKETEDRTEIERSKFNDTFGGRKTPQPNQTFESLPSSEIIRAQSNNLVQEESCLDVPNQIDGSGGGFGDTSHFEFATEDLNREKEKEKQGGGMSPR